jgi:hypothetical protein
MSCRRLRNDHAGDPSLALILGLRERALGAWGILTLLTTQHLHAPLLGARPKSGYPVSSSMLTAPHGRAQGLAVDVIVRE